MFDVIITYGPRIETFRGVVINGDLSLAPDVRINGDTSTLVTVIARRHARRSEAAGRSAVRPRTSTSSSLTR
jgi:hypothetical protein